MSSNAPDMPPIVIAVSLPITCAATWVTTSQITGLTLPGMIEEPFCSSGRISSPSPARGPEPIQRMSFAIFVSEAATTLSAPEVSISASRLACASKWSSGAAIGSREASASRVRTRWANSGCVFSPVPVAVPPSGICPSRGSASSTRAAPELDLRRVAAELLAERDGHGVHEVRAARLDDRRELRSLGRERRLELAERGQQVVRGRVQRGEVDRRGEHVVRGLAEVDVVVGMRRPRRRAWP